MLGILDIKLFAFFFSFHINFIYYICNLNTYETNTERVVKIRVIARGRKISVFH